MTTDLEKQIATVLNIASAENDSNTPDFILAQYLLSCLAAFNQAIQQRETWHGRDARPQHALSDTEIEQLQNQEPIPEGWTEYQEHETAFQKMKRTMQEQKEE